MSNISMVTYREMCTNAHILGFYGVFFQIEDICSQTCDKNIRETIQSLPKDLPETYERALHRIRKGGKVDIATRVFCLVAGAKRPLSVEELREAMAVEPFSSKITASRLSQC